MLQSFRVDCFILVHVQNVKETLVGSSLQLPSAGVIALSRSDRRAVFCGPAFGVRPRHVNRPRVKREYFYGIDAVRFLSALLVAFFHLGFSCWASPTSGAADVLRGAYALPQLAEWTWFGWAGVEIFFVISGFVITSSAEQATPVQFFNSRVLRLYPAVWICATTTLIVILVSDLHASWFSYVTSMFLVPSGPWIDGQYWTLGVEIVFYAIVFLLLRLRQFELVGHVAVAMGLVSATFLLLLTLYPDLRFLANGIWRLTLLYYGVYFSLGIFIRLWIRNRMRPLFWMTAFICLAAGALQTRFHSIDMGTRVIFSPVSLADHWYVSTLVFYAGFIAIGASAVYRARFDALSDGALRVLRILGLATFPLYLLHFKIGVLLARRLVLWGVPPIAALLATISILVAFAILIAARLEPPVRSALKRALIYAEEHLGLQLR